MKHYKKLIEFGCFSRSDIVELVGNESTANSLLREYLRKNYIERVRRDRFVTISLETKQPIVSRYRIGCSLFPDAVISHHSAFEVYGYANQVYYMVCVTTESRFSDFTYDGITYHRVAPNHGQQIATVNGVRMTGIEQTVVDSIADFEQLGGLEETLRCLQLIPALHEEKLIEILVGRSNGFLWQKCGYLLSVVPNTFRLSDSFFEECRRHKTKSKRSLMQNAPYEQIWDPKWGLYVPAHAEALWNKGVNDDDAI